MLAAAAIVSLLVLATRIAGPEFVTHERAAGMCCRPPHTAVSISPSLSVLTADRRLLIASDRSLYRPRLHRSPPAVIVAILLLLGGVELNPGPTSPRDAMTSGLLNVRSAVNKAALIHDVVADHQLDLLVLTETWIASDAPNAIKLDVAPPGYAVVHRHRGSSADRRGGGLAVIHRNSTKTKPVSVGEYTEFESLAVKLVGRRSSSIVAVCIYRPPGSVTTAFTDQLSDLLDQLLLLDSTCVILGDFNVPGDVGGIDRRVADVFSQYGLCQHVSCPTHDDGNMLDLIVTRVTGPARHQLVTDVAVQSVCFSDHHLLTCRLGLPTSPPVSVSYNYRPIRRISLPDFRHDVLRSALFGSVSSDVDEYAERFDSEVQRVLDKHAPLRTGRRRCGMHDNRHLSDEARQAKQLRRRLERRYRRTGLSADKQAYRSAKSAARDSIMKSRADYIKSQLDEAAGDTRATWRTAQRLLHSRENETYDDTECMELVSKFSEYFVDKVRRIRDNIAEALHHLADRVFAVRLHTGPELTSFQPVTVDEVRKMLSSMPCKSSPLDILPSSLLKSCADVFAPAITILANLSLQSGKFPARFRTAQVLPLLKKAGLDRSSPASYRPISNLSTVSKVLERLVLARLRPHLISSPNFSRYQSAYRKCHSTETAILEILDGVYTAADEQQVSVLIGLDLSAAFDTVCHDTLLRRLQTEFGVSGTVLSWLQSYLRDRQQFVKLGHHQSPVTQLDVGVPQGSVLGPLLFAVYSSPVADIIAQHGVQFHQYADDTQLHLAMRAGDTATGRLILAACTSDVKHWYMQNGLQLNPDKSESLVIGTSNQLQAATSSLATISVAGVDLPTAEHMKVLGVTLDRRLSFDQHVSAVARSCNFHAQAIRHIRPLLTRDLAATLTCSLILSRIDYCNAILHGAPVGCIRKLQRVQNNAAKIVCQASRRSHARPLLKELHWLPVVQRISYKVATLTYKIRQTSTPAYLSEHITDRTTTRNLRSASAPTLVQPFCRTTFAKRAFRCSAPSVWNSLPATVSNSDSLSVFKSRLKTHLFRQAFN